MDDLTKSINECTLFNKNGWIGKNENDLILNIFFMAIISSLFIHATIFIFPQVSDRLYADILKKKLDMIAKFMKLEFNYDLKETLKKSFSGKKYKKIKDKRNAKNRKTIFKKISSFRILTYILLAASLVVIGMKWKRCGKLILDWSHLFIIFVMIFSFSTEIFIFLFVFSKYIYMPNMKMFAIILDQFVNILKKNEYFTKNTIDLNIDDIKDKKDKLKENADQIKSELEQKSSELKDKSSKLKQNIVKKVKDAKEWSAKEKEKIIKTVEEITDDKIDEIEAKIDIAQKHLANKQDLFSKDQERIKQDLEIMKSKLDLDSSSSKKKTKSQQKEQKEQQLRKKSRCSHKQRSPDPHDSNNIFCPISY